MAAMKSRTIAITQSFGDRATPPFAAECHQHLGVPSAASHAHAFAHAFGTNVQTAFQEVIETATVAHAPVVVGARSGRMLKRRGDGVSGASGPLHRQGPAPSL